MPFRNIALVVTWSIDVYASRLKRGRPVRTEVQLTRGEMKSALAGEEHVERDEFRTDLGGNL